MDRSQKKEFAISRVDQWIEPRPDYEKAYNEGKAASENGDLKVVEERILEPYRGYGFELKKGQVIHYELIDGPQALDIVYLVKDRPNEELAAGYPTAMYTSIQQYEGDILFSEQPFCRPLLTIIRDIVDYGALREKIGETACHMWNFNGGHCQHALIEDLVGVVNCNSCDMNLVEGLMEVGGEKLARLMEFRMPVFCMFAQAGFEDARINHAVISGKGLYKRGDFVELLAHDDLFVGISLCPQGDFNHTSTLNPEDWVSWPLKVKILEGRDKPLFTIPEPERKSMRSIDFVKAGRPGMVKGKVGNNNSPAFFG